MNLPVNISDIIERGRSHQQKTIDAILAFAACVVELRNACITARGGSEFSKLAQEHWGLSQSMLSKWLNVGMKIGNLELIHSVNKFPSSLATLYELVMTDQELLSTIEISPSLTRQAVIDHRRGIISEPEPMPEPVSLTVAETLPISEPVAESPLPEPVPLIAPTYSQTDIESHAGKDGANPKPETDLNMNKKSGIDEETMREFEALEKADDIRKAINKVLKLRPDLCAIVVKILIQKVHPDKPGGNTELLKLLVK